MSGCGRYVGYHAPAGIMSFIFRARTFAASGNLLMCIFNEDQRMNGRRRKTSTEDCLRLVP